MLSEPIDLRKTTVKPVLKWAGGKRQLLPQLLQRMPRQYKSYLEPFFGGGALFFQLRPEKSIIADSNAELINLYQIVAEDHQALIKALRAHKNEAEYFYELRACEWTTMCRVQAASRTLFLNRTCFNGLYRVNKKGQFNVPFGKYVNPNFCDEQTLALASTALQRATILECDYKQVLQRHAKEGDFVFLDPPYHPISQYSDFKRYTKEQFNEQDHRELAEEVARLHEIGCHVLLTNSNSELVLDLYKRYQIDVIETKRNINSKASKRVGQDVIVTVTPSKVYRSSSQLNDSNTTTLSSTISDATDTCRVKEQIARYPSTRFMGSKSKLLSSISEAIKSQPCNTVLDLFSGSGVVSYMLKAEGRQVISNDYMAFSSLIGKALIENSHITLPDNKAKALLQPAKNSDGFVEQNFAGLYFTNDENRLIDQVRANIKLLDNPYEQAIAISALVRACFKRRPRGIFTYVGHRYDDGRKDLKTSLDAHFLEAVRLYNGAVFDNGQSNSASRQDALQTEYKPDLVYIDPPYYSPHSDNEYVRRYHFVEGIACDWKGVEMQWQTKTRKFKNYPTPFSTKKGTYEAFDRLFSMYQDSTLVVSYSSNSQPSKEQMIDLLYRYKSNVEVASVSHRYSFGNQAHKVRDNHNDVSEYIFIANG